VKLGRQYIKLKNPQEFFSLTSLKPTLRTLSGVTTGRIPRPPLVLRPMVSRSRLTAPRLHSNSPTHSTSTPLRPTRPRPPTAEHHQRPLTTLPPELHMLSPVPIPPPLQPSLPAAQTQQSPILPTLLSLPPPPWAQQPKPQFPFRLVQLAPPLLQPPITPVLTLRLVGSP
jgi:hypothetical protein